MKIKIIKEAGYYEALLGLSLSYNRPVDEMIKVSRGLYNKDGGHNKFLESIKVWLDVYAPRYLWSECDTYRLSTKQSESTMHTILRRGLTKQDFEAFDIPESYLSYLNILIQAGDLKTLKKALPESFIQRRIWCMDYKCLRNILWQRYNHRLDEWPYFCRTILDQVEHIEYFKDIEERIEWK